MDEFKIEDLAQNLHKFSGDLMERPPILRAMSREQVEGLRDTIAPLIGGLLTFDSVLVKWLATLPENG